MSKPMCKYGSDCYRKNPDHFEQYDHPSTNLDETEEVGTRSRKRSLEIEDLLDEDSIPSPKRTKPSDPESNSSDSEDDSISLHTSECTVASTDDPRETIPKLFLVKMPEDFYQFWDFCTEIHPDDPINAMEAIGLKLTGPFDVLTDNIQGMTWEQCVLHGRHYFDPPEFQTVAMRNDGFHIGYFRDDPKSDTCFVVSNSASDGCIIKIIGSNLFSATVTLIEKALVDSSLPEKPIEDLDASLRKKARSLGVDLKQKKDYKRNVVAKCFNQLGISVPVDAVHDVGYRALTMTNRELKRLLDNIASKTDKRAQELACEPLQEMITFVQFANDECDYGMGLELGIDLFGHGDPIFHDYILRLLPLAYELLDRSAFGKIIKEHLKKRRRDLSVSKD